MNKRELSWREFRYNMSLVHFRGAGGQIYLPLDRAVSPCFQSLCKKANTFTTFIVILLVLHFDCWFLTVNDCLKSTDVRYQQTLVSVHKHRLDSDHVTAIKPWLVCTVYLQFLHCSSDLKINTFKAKSHSDVYIQCAGVEPTQMCAVCRPTLYINTERSWIQMTGPTLY